MRAIISSHRRLACRRIQPPERSRPNRAARNGSGNHIAQGICLHQLQKPVFRVLRPQFFFSCIILTNSCNCNPQWQRKTARKREILRFCLFFIRPLRYSCTEKRNTPPSDKQTDRIARRSTPLLDLLCLWDDAHGLPDRLGVDLCPCCRYLRFKAEIRISGHQQLSACNSLPRHTEAVSGHSLHARQNACARRDYVRWCFSVQNGLFDRRSRTTTRAHMPLCCTVSHCSFGMRRSI